MKKLLMFVFLITATLTLTGCDFGKEEIDDFIDPDRQLILDDCQGMGDYIVVDGVCILIGDIVSQNIVIGGDETRVQYLNGVELMSGFVADLAGSKGLAVVSKEVFENDINLGGSTYYDLINLAADDDPEEDAENIIVKLTEEGFFEEVGFTNEAGVDVVITSNPLALEVFGAYTIVVFEVDLGYEYYTPDFTQRVFDSLHAGGVYLIHNESGKMFATKEIEQVENVYTYTENHSRNINIMVTLNVPVVEIQYVFQLDEFGMPIFGDDGIELYDEVEVPLFDQDGNPIVFTEGPILTEFLEVPVVEYYKVQQVDEDGNLVFDENQEPVYDVVEEPVLDENGNPKIELQEVPVLDDDGNVQYQQEFEVELYIEDIKAITITEYSASVTDNPVSNIAHRFADKIIAEYYNWNYYRVNNYMITSFGFAASEENIFYTEMKVDEDDGSKSENFVMKISFDSTTNEILLEEYLNATKAGFTECEIIIDPISDNIICDSWDGNLKVYSSTYGLKVIPDTENFNPVTFPNGELYFYDSMETYVEELGYYTTLLYTINDDGTLESYFIELGEKEEVCFGACYNSINVNFFNQAGEAYGNIGYVDLQLSDGDKMFLNADLQVQSIGEFSSERPECTDTNGCWYNTKNEVIDAAGEFVTSFESSVVIYPGDPVPGYLVTYQLDSQTVYEYEQMYSDDDLICDNEIGCTSHINLVDYSINSEGYWMYDSIIVEDGEKVIESIELAETNTAVYEYTKDVVGEVCGFTTCEEYVNIQFYDFAGELLSETNTLIQIAEGETIPLNIEYHITGDTTVTEKTNLCTTSTGCYEYYETSDSIHYYIFYEQGDTMYETIDFADTDKTVVTSKTLTNEICTDINGCYGGESEYIIVDNEGVELYNFSNYAFAEYGYRVPFKVTVNINDVTIRYRKESLIDDMICEETICRSHVEIVIGTTINNVSLGWADIAFAQDEKIMIRIILDDDTVKTVESEMICDIAEGCYIYSSNYIIVDSEGTEFQNEDPNWYKQHLPVFFANGDSIPVDNQFEVTFEIIAAEYLKNRIFVHEFLYNLNNVIVLDENLYLIEQQSWAIGNDNFILEFNETTGRYSAKYTNISAITEITAFGDGFIAINDDETAIMHFSYNTELSSEDYYYFDIENLTEGLLINGVNDLIVDYDGSIYFKGVDNFIQDITGSISEDGVVTIDTEFVERQIIRVRPIN